jgi:hypothetical protein
MNTIMRHRGAVAETTRHEVEGVQTLPSLPPYVAAA